MMNPIRTVRNGALTLGTALALAACGSAQHNDQTLPQSQVTYRAPSGAHEALVDGHTIPVPKGFEGVLYVQSPHELPITAKNDAHVEYLGETDGMHGYKIQFIGSESSRPVADVGGRTVSAHASPNRVAVDDDQFYDAVSVGRGSTPATQNELEELVAETVGSFDFADENRFYAVLKKDESGNYNDFHSYGAIAGPEAVKNAFAELYECAGADLDEVRVRVMQGNFSGPETTNGTVVEAYSGGQCLAQMLVGDSANLAEVAARASQLGNAFAPQAAAEAYLSGVASEVAVRGYARTGDGFVIRNGEGGLARFVMPEGVNFGSR